MTRYRRVLVLLVCLLWLTPLALLVAGSVTPEQAIIEGHTSLRLTLDNYQNLLQGGAFLVSLRNSIVCAVFATLIAGCVGGPAAYAAIHRPIAFNGVFGWILSTRILPPVAILIPLFITFQTFHATNSLVGISLVVGAANVPVVAWLMRQFMSEIPPHLVDAIRLDGGQERDVFRSLILPLAGPGIIVAILLGFVFAWNDYLFAAVLVSAPSLRTLPLLAGSFVTGYRIEWGLMLACDVLLIVPPFLVGAAAAPQILRILVERSSDNRRVVR